MLAAPLVVLLVLLGGCGEGSDAGLVTVDPPAAPLLPGRDATWAFGDETAWRSLASFNGDRWDDTPDAGRAVLLPDTVCDHPTRATWAAAGLVRNESTGPVSISVHVTLVDVSGSVLEQLATDVPVRAVRSGEPAPFLVQSRTVDPRQVADARWEVRAAPAVATRGTIALTEWWQRPNGVARPIDMYLRSESPGEPFPYALFGAATNEGVAVGATDVVAAWLDDQQRVCWVASVPLSSPMATSAVPAGTPRTRTVGSVDSVGTAGADGAARAPEARSQEPAPVTTMATASNPGDPTGTTMSSSPDTTSSTTSSTTSTTSTTSSTTSTTSTTILERPAPAPDAAGLAPGAAADFLFIVDDPVSAGFTGVVLLWAVPR